MSRQGATFYCIIEERERQPALWDPNRYRAVEGSGTLGDYVEVRGLRRLRAAPASPFRAIEYRDISRDDHLTFTLEEQTVETVARKRSAKHCAVGEQALLMG